MSSLRVGGLRFLMITDLDIERRCEWTSRLMAQNRNTLQLLQLGILSTIAKEYAINGRLNQHEFPNSFADMAKEILPASEQEMMRMMSVKALGLYGLNFDHFVRGTVGLKIDFENMTRLRLESCSGLTEAFIVLRGNNDSQNATWSALKLTTFMLRHEAGGQVFAQHLTAFLTSFTGLIHLVLLLEGQNHAMSKAPILEIHGKTLKTLVWDERRRPRKDTETDTSSKHLKNNDLGFISLKCPNLTALGLATGWEFSKLQTQVGIMMGSPVQHIGTDCQ